MKWKDERIEIANKDWEKYSNIFYPTDASDLENDILIILEGNGFNYTETPSLLRAEVGKAVSDLKKEEYLWILRRRKFLTKGKNLQ